MVNGYGFALLTSLKDSKLDLTNSQGIVGIQFDILYIGWITTLMSLGISKCKLPYVNLGFWWTYSLIPVVGLIKAIQFYKSLLVDQSTTLSNSPIRKTKLRYD